MTLNAFLEAAKKATAGEWFFTRITKADGCHAAVLNGAAIDAERFTDYVVEECDSDDTARFIAAARNAAAEIAELRNLCRKITTRGQTVSAEDMERIREIVK